MKWEVKWETFSLLKSHCSNFDSGGLLLSSVQNLRQPINLVISLIWFWLNISNLLLMVFRCDQKILHNVIMSPHLRVFELQTLGKQYIKIHKNERDSSSYYKPIGYKTLSSVAPAKDHLIM
jgi:hypothetical protein